MNPNNGKIHHYLVESEKLAETSAQLQTTFHCSHKHDQDCCGAFINLGCVRKTKDKYQLAIEVINIGAINRMIQLYQRHITKRSSYARYQETEDFSYSTQLFQSLLQSGQLGQAK